MKTDKTRVSRSRGSVYASIFAIAVGIGAPGLLFAQAAFSAAEWAKVTAAARQEGRVVIYTNVVAAVNDRLKADFEQANPGIKVEWNRIIGAAATARLDQERDTKADGADIAVIDDMSWMDKRIQDATLKAPAGPALAGYPANFIRQRVMPVVELQAFIIAYNANLVKTPVTGYQDLLRPEFKGTKLAAQELVGPAIVALYDWLEKTQGGGILEKLAAQEPRLYVSAQPATQGVASGEVVAALISTFSIAKPLQTQGAPIRIVVPRPSMGFQTGAAVLAWGKRPNAALVYLDYLMSVRGQSVWHGPGETASPLTGIPGSLDGRSITPFDASKYPPDVVKPFTERWNGMFKARK